ncbi:MAG: hypothetical protein BAJALOKI1v1_710012 [Promethearchaeota archaeon]|nr:MAG: hypothetical protein BAJALOKI1v1_710012 [Candidatus Lokiarchaeota archaeon]
MTSVKMNNKELLEKLQAKITLRLGKKPTQQELLDKSVEFAYKQIDTFIFEEFQQHTLTKEIIEKIRSNTIDAPLAYPDKSDDELIYDL